MEQEQEPQQTDHDLLIELSTNMRLVMDFLRDHHAHHRNLTYAGIAFALGLISTIIIAL